MTMGLQFIGTFASEKLGLTKLPPYLLTFYWSLVGFLFVHQVLAPWASNRWFVRAYGGKGKMAKNNWSIHVVSQVHTVIILPLSLWCILIESPERTSDRAFGWEKNIGYVHAIACGYFLWDTLDAIINFTDLGFVIHGLVCFLIYITSFKPFVAYYGTRFLVWEASTFFLNIHWFLDKTGQTGSRAQLVNGLFLLSTFFCVRLIYGGAVSYQFFYTLLDVGDNIPLAYRLVYGVGNFVLQGLNWFWFTKMIFAIRKRFTSTDERTKLIGQNGNDVENGA
ncbi:uncharacterized protein LACBIDRAFT_305847 [Laccaria bicolor S238N-H82]|uniref:Predicted protein n=1 Tax=Laccaria bicolor (strain S238N-H82 / ATCC MYA-4686) TaxID=486041 RepID=B0CS27_LACBS|nr:uncharacterized protein LACBIDRAFT_305847 [Laccaria bicolor S238N-H82]EDR14781.1 predicted protein [Laccaria bicolor S238N-H82]|eukprot:XP_001875340.1 predicted protein [Laccaria bicolor S238N-H82]